MAERKKYDPRDPFGLVAKQTTKSRAEPTSGNCDQSEAVVQSNVGSFGSITSTLSQEKIMSEPTKQELAEAAAKAKIEAKAAKKAEAEAKKAAAEQKRQEAAAAKEAKLKAAAEAKEAKAAEKEAAAKARAEARAAAAVNRREANPDAATAEGMSSALRDKVQLGLYVKGKNGQLRTNDEIALALEVVPVADMVPLLLAVLGLTENPYTHLNQGQQSMNLRNRLRGAIRKGAKIEGTEEVINLERLHAHVASIVAAAEKPSTDAATGDNAESTGE